MTGLPFEQKVAEQKALLEGILGDRKTGNRQQIALDLGSGPGFQSIALAELGFGPVVAVDSSSELLGELKARGSGHAINVREADLTSLGDIAIDGDVAVVVCMGDTLTHLPSKEAITRLFGNVFRKLAVGGTFVVTYRDLTEELTGTDRFLPVRGDENKVMTCFLQYENSETVLVTDLVHLRNGADWTLEKSSYHKLRLSRQWVVDALRTAGFEIQTDGTAGRLLLAVARKRRLD